MSSGNEARRAGSSSLLYSYPTLRDKRLRRRPNKVFGGIRTVYDRLRSISISPRMKQNFLVILVILFITSIIITLRENNSSGPHLPNALDEDRAIVIKRQFELLGDADPETAKEALQSASMIIYNGESVSGVTRKSGKVDTAASALLEALLMDMAQVQCRYDPSLPTIFPKNEKILFAANFHNNDHQMPFIIYNLVQVVSIVGPDLCYVSVYESMSEDSTSSWLIVMKFLLDQLGVRNRIVSDGSETFMLGRDRVDYNSALRNLALEPIWTKVPSLHFDADRVVFMSDVFFCARDVIRLLNHDNSIACGMDYQMKPTRTFADSLDKEVVLIGLHNHLINRYWFPRWLAKMAGTMGWVLDSYKKTVNLYALGTQEAPLNFYDIYTAKDVDGHPFTKTPPYISHLYSQERLSRGLPFPVHCCWNGLIVFSAQPFKDGLRFRRPQPGECKAPEPNMMCDDFQRLGYTDFIVDPGVRQADHVDAAKLLYDTSKVRGIENADWSQLEVAEPINYKTIAKQVNKFCCALHNRTLCKVQPLHATNYTSMFFKAHGHGG